MSEYNTMNTFPAGTFPASAAQPGQAFPQMMTPPQQMPAQAPMMSGAIDLTAVIDFTPQPADEHHSDFIKLAVGEYKATILSVDIVDNQSYDTSSPLTKSAELQIAVADHLTGQTVGVKTYIKLVESMRWKLNQLMTAVTPTAGQNLIQYFQTLAGKELGVQIGYWDKTQGRLIDRINQQTGKPVYNEINRFIAADRVRLAKPQGQQAVVTSARPQVLTPQAPQMMAQPQQMMSAPVYQTQPQYQPVQPGQVGRTNTDDPTLPF